LIVTDTDLEQEAISMHRTGLATAAVAIGGLLVLPAAPLAAHADSRCIRVDGACFSTVAAALDAADDGDTVRIPRGTFRGGITITKSITLAGTGMDDTALRGGGPVLTIGTLGQPTPPTVTVRDLTITGGHTSTSDLSRFLTGEDGIWALGGGIEVPPGAFDDDFLPAPGATVTLLRTRLSDNRAAPSASVPSGLPCPGGQDCPFAIGAGGGIDTWGDLTVVDSLIQGNQAGGAAAGSSAAGRFAVGSDAEGGGVRSWVGRLTVRHSRVQGNVSTTTAPGGRFAEGGGIFHGGGFLPTGGRFTLRDSHITGNTARLDAGLPDSVDDVPIDHVAIGGGVQLTGEVPDTLIEHTTVTGNTARMTNTVGSATAFAGGVLTNLPTASRIVHSTFRDNRASARTRPGSDGLAHADTGALQLHGTLSDSVVRDNTVRAIGVGDAEALAGGVWVLQGEASDVRVRDNSLTAVAPHGTATVHGGGMVIDHAPEEDPGGLTMSDSRVSRNTGTAVGRATLSRGGGIFDALVSPDLGPFGGPLTLTRVRVEHNILAPAATARGGGLFLEDQPLALRATRIRHNEPDQCVGCGTAGERSSRRPLSAPSARRVHGVHRVHGAQGAQAPGLFRDPRRPVDRATTGNP
jgi:hypothetical protein